MDYFYLKLQASGAQNLCFLQFVTKQFLHSSNPKLSLEYVQDHLLLVILQKNFKTTLINKDWQLVLICRPKTSLTKILWFLESLLSLAVKMRSFTKIMFQNRNNLEDSLCKILWLTTLMVYLITLISFFPRTRKVDGWTWLHLLLLTSWMSNLWKSNCKLTSTKTR